MIKNLRPVDGSEQPVRQGWELGERADDTGKALSQRFNYCPCCIVAFSPLLHVAMRSNPVVEKEHLWHLLQLR